RPPKTVWERTSRMARFRRRTRAGTRATRPGTKRGRSNRRSVCGRRSSSVRQGDSEGRADAFGGLERDGAVHRLHTLGGDRQTEADPFRAKLPVARSVGPEEATEDPGLIRGRNADAVVPDPNVARAVPFLERQLDER